MPIKNKHKIDIFHRNEYKLIVIKQDNFYNRKMQKNSILSSNKIVVKLDY